MKKLHLLAALVASAAMLSAAGSPARAENIAIIDLSWIFKNHLAFNARTDKMRRDVQAAEADLRKDRDAIAETAKNFKDSPEFKPGSPDYKQMEIELTKRQADLQVEVSLQKKRFLEQESRIYYDIYQEVLAEVKRYAAQNKIGIVFRFTGDPADVNDAQSILKELNKSVVWYEERIDITPTILDNLNAKYKQRVGTRPPRAGVPPRTPN